MRAGTGGIFTKGAVLLLNFLMAMDVAGQTGQAKEMAALRQLAIPGATVTSVERNAETTLTGADSVVYSDVAPRTIVKMHLSPVAGSNIDVEIWLPDVDAWNGRLMGQGNAGAAGNINSMMLARHVAGGYATAITDMGTAPDAASGIGNPEVWKDFGFRATHLMTVVAKQIIEAYYGRPPEYSYFNGGSTGGQQALQLAQRYPADYDGIVASVPAHCRTPLHAYFLWNSQILANCPFTAEQMENVQAAGVEYAAPRETPASAGKFVSDPRFSSEDIEGVIALARKKDSTLTDAHADALRKLFDGPTNPRTGERIFNGIPVGSPIDAAHGHLYLFNWVFGAGMDLQEFDFAEDMDTYTAALAPYLNADNPDLSAFEKRGGKLVMLSGSADSIVPYHASLDYYERVIEHAGSLERAQSFIRYYVVPGMGHGGGPGVNETPIMIELVRKWREGGEAPAMIPGKRIVDGKTEWEIPIFPYPLWTEWDAASGTYKAVERPRGGVERIAERYLPPASE